MCEQRCCQPSPTKLDILGSILNAVLMHRTKSKVVDGIFQLYAETSSFNNLLVH